MKVSREVLTILASIAVTLAVWWIFDVEQFIYIIPLSNFGMTHWIPEGISMFLISSYLAKTFNLKTRWGIFVTVMLFPPLAYVFSNNVQFGVGTSCVFCAIMLLAFLSVDRKKDNQNL